MSSKYRAICVAKWLGTSCAGAIVLFHSSAAFAACTSTGGAVVCDTSAPNPSDPIVGSDILLLPGAQVKQLDDPYAGASVPFTLDTVTLSANGRLEARATTLIKDFINNTASVNAGVGSTVLANGSISNTGNYAVGLQLAGNASLTVGSTGSIYASGFRGTGVLVTGTGATLQIDGTIGNGTSRVAISTIRYDINGNPTAIGSANITVGATGLVRSTAAPAIVLSNGSSLDILGTVRSDGGGSAVDYRGAAGGSASVTIEAGGKVQSTSQPAIVGSTGSLNLTIAGNVDAAQSSTAIQLGTGNDTVTIVTGASIRGLIDAGAGTDALILSGPATLGGTANFGTATFTSGVWTLAAPLQVANGMTIAAGAIAIGSADKFASAATDNGTLQFEQSTDATFAGSITGNGQLIKSGAGSLTLGPQGFSGSTLVSQGLLVLAGGMPSEITVAHGGTLGGRGAVSSLTVEAGGTVAPGGATGTGTISVAGNFVQKSGSTYSATLLNGVADTIMVGGTATVENGATLAISRQGAGLGHYTLLDASGGLAGQFSVVQAIDLGVYSLSYTADSIVLNLGRSNQDLRALAQGGNAQAVASALEQLPQSSPVYNTLVTTSNDATVTAAYGQLAGDIYAALPSAMIHGADLVADAVIGRTGPASRLQLWGQFLGSSGDMSGPAYVSDIARHSYGGLLGIEGGSSNVTVGIAGGYVHTRLLNAASEARIRMPQVLVYTRAHLPHFDLQAGAGYFRALGRVDRTISFGGFSDSDEGHYRSNVVYG